ncbi:MAG: hypothetical protein WAN65_03810, partial [Candidatus Sulfotelmatobacter sp.]
LIRVEPRVWGHDAQGNSIQGCFRAVGAYRPSDETPTPGAVTPPVPDSSLNRTVGIFTVVSLAVGTIATVVSMKRDKKK